MSDKFQFGDKPIQDITPHQYSEFLKKIYKHGTTRKENQEEKLTKNEKRRKKVTNGYSLSYVESMLKFLYLVMHHAAQIKVITYEKYNEFRDNCKPPKAQKKKDKQKIRVLTRKQIADIKELLKDTDFYLPFLVALLAGTRPAETFALRFSDFDFENKILTIDKQIVDEEGALVIKNPKTEHSFRNIDISDFLISEVKKRMAYLEEQRKLNPKAFKTNKGRLIDGREFEEPTMDMPDDMMCRDGKGRYVTAHSFSYIVPLCPIVVSLKDNTPCICGLSSLSNLRQREINQLSVFFGVPSKICKRCNSVTASLCSAPKTLLLTFSEQGVANIKTPIILSS